VNGLFRPRQKRAVQAALRLSLALSLALVAWPHAGFAAPVTGTDVTYTLDADFDQGTQLNVNHDDPAHDQLQLNRIARPFPYVNIAASARGTMLRIDADTGAILGEYLTAPDGMARNPSRTTVDLLGNTWVANRDESSFSEGAQKGSVVRVGVITGGTRVAADGTLDPVGDYLQPPFGYNTCVDRDADGLIRTSRGQGHILPWSNAGDADRHGGVATAEDECIINYTRVAGTNTRTVAIDANNDVWVGGMNLWHEKLDGTTGQPVSGTAFNVGCGGYGGFMDRNGVLWSSRNGTGLLRYDTATATGQCLPFDRGDYGLGVDPQTGHIWQTYLSNGQVAELDTNGNELHEYSHGSSWAQGVAVDGSGNVWVAHSLNGSSVGHLRTDGTFVGVIPVGSGPTGVAVDANGKVWVANINANTAVRIDPNAGPVGGGGYPVGAVDLTVELGAGAGPYNYSDMTGFVAFGSTSPQGNWSVTQDSGTAGNSWGTIAWNTEAEGQVPAGASITVEARADDTEAGLGGQSFVPVANGIPFAMNGRYMEVRVILRANAAGESPVLSDLRIRTANMPPVVQLDPAGPIDEGSAPVTLTATASDPDGDPLTYTWSMAGTGVLTPTGTTATYFNDDGPGSATVTVTVDDGKGGTATASTTVEVLNVAPTVDAGPDQQHYWGLPVSVSGSATDPSQADTDAGLNPTWTLDGGAFLASAYSASHTYADPGAYTLTLTATDKDGGVGTDSAAITITKRPSTLSGSDAAQVYGYAATLSAQFGDAVDAATALPAGRTIQFVVDGTAYTATTDLIGMAAVPVPAGLMPGMYLVDVTFAEDSHYLGSATQLTLTVGSTPGKVTAGTLRSEDNGRGGFNVQSDGTTVQGELQFQNDSMRIHAHTLTALGISADGKSAWFAGVTTEGLSFVAYVEDNGEPGRNDKFQLWVEGVSQNGDGSLRGGNVQIH
jgi:hypothetical protein